MDDLSYLQPGFDPSTLRVPELRRALVMHEVHFPSTAKKAVLIDLFNQHIVPNSQRLLATAEATGEKVSAIVDANIATSISTETPRPRRNTERKTTIRKRSSSTASPSRMAAQATPIQPVSINDAIKVEDEISPFSAENPFQTPTAVKPKRSYSKRGSLPKTPKPPKETTPKTTPKSRTPKSAQSVKVPVTAKSFVSDTTSPGIAKFSSELFVNDAQYDDFLESEEEMTKRGLELSLVNEPDAPFSFPLKVFIAWLFTVSWLMYLMWWRNEKFRIGYCDVELYKTTDDSNGLFKALMPGCTPCPPHAVCYEGFVAECQPDFVYRSSWLSFGGVFPMPPKCVPDTDKWQRAAILRQESVHILRERYAAVECANALNDTTIAVEDLRSKLYKIKSPRLTDDMFEELWMTALKQLLDLDEVYKVDDEFGQRIGSTSTAEFPWSCVVRNDLGEFMNANKGTFIGVAVATLILFWSYNKLMTLNARRSRVRELVDKSLEFVAAQQQQSDRDSTGTTARYVVMTQIKDALLQDVTDAAERRNIWDSVQRQIESNSKVRSRQMEVHGEIMRIWEWIGM
ncbi:Man1-Src1p-C-terminal domain-containing protein [Lipomyces arxii]|uniref:Man1-Src1p-C-terminal domain-containing protein n=1 Tax=Lipomyces arxii TaxID=56418 RepID=UPI0034CF0BBF